MELSIGGRMKYRVIMLMALFCTVPFITVIADTVWDESLYGTYDAASFGNYAHAREPIDFDNIHYNLLNAAIFYETNRMRLKHGRDPFIHAQSLEDAAFMHATDMVRFNFLSHTNPHESKKRTFTQRLAMFGVEQGYRAENISEMFGIRYVPGSPLIPPDTAGAAFKDFNTGKPIQRHSYLTLAEALLNGWMNSSGHRANILNSNLIYLGCGAYHYKNKSFYGMDQFKAVQNFASNVSDG
jgi:uncharacterized protein YkwD